MTPVIRDSIAVLANELSESTPRGKRKRLARDLRAILDGTDLADPQHSGREAMMRHGVEVVERALDQTENVQ